MNKIAILMLTCLIGGDLMAVIAACAACSLFAVSDSQISEMLLRSTRVIDNDEVADRMVRHAESLCEHDTNRFVRLVCELAQTNDTQIANQMIQCLGTYGSSADIPFLRVASTNNVAGMSAITSILQLSGVNETSLADLDRFLREGRTDGAEKIFACSSFMNWSKRPGVAQSTRDALKEIFMSYGTSNADVAVMFDRMMCRVDLSYTKSLRRLRTLRTTMDAGLHPFQAQYVTNAINELVAYPEANLPE